MRARYSGRGRLAHRGRLPAVFNLGFAWEASYKGKNVFLVEYMGISVYRRRRCGESAMSIIGGSSGIRSLE